MNYEIIAQPLLGTPYTRYSLLVNGELIQRQISMFDPDDIPGIIQRHKSGEGYLYAKITTLRAKRTASKKKTLGFDPGKSNKWRSAKGTASARKANLRKRAQNEIDRAKLAWKV